MFYKIAIPVVIVTIVVFGWEYLMNMFIGIRRLALRMYHRSVSRSARSADFPLLTFVLLEQLVERRNKVE